MTMIDLMHYVRKRTRNATGTPADSKLAIGKTGREGGKESLYSSTVPSLYGPLITSFTAEYIKTVSTARPSNHTAQHRGSSRRRQNHADSLAGADQHVDIVVSAHLPCSTALIARYCLIGSQQGAL